MTTTTFSGSVLKSPATTPNVPKMHPDQAPAFALAVLEAHGWGHPPEAMNDWHSPQGTIRGAADTLAVGVRDFERWQVWAAGNPPSPQADPKIRPSECELCVPLETENPSNGIITRAHEPECINHPTNQEH